MNLSNSRFSDWASLWPRLLVEAARLASKAERGKREVSRSAAAVILARTSIESFTNEYIEWRDPLSVDLKQENGFKERVKAIYASLGVSQPCFGGNGLWAQANLLVHLRNHIVHHQAQPLSGVGEAPQDIVRRLRSLDVVEVSNEDLPWEQRVLVGATARWACYTACNVILELERIESGRRRSLGLVEAAIRSARSELEEC